MLCHQLSAHHLGCLSSKKSVHYLCLAQPQLSRRCAAHATCLWPTSCPGAHACFCACCLPLLSICGGNSCINWGLLRSFEDSRGWCCAAYTEVAIDYNAGYTGALARLAGYFADQQPFSDCGLDLGWSHPNASAVRPDPGMLLVWSGRPAGLLPEMAPSVDCAPVPT